MKDTEQDKFDNLFRDQLYDFEAMPMEEDWDLIASRLPKGKSVPFRRIFTWVSAAAVLSFVMVTATLFLSKKVSRSDVVAEDMQEIRKEVAKPEKEIEESLPEEPVTVVAAPVAPSAVQASARTVKKTAVAAKKTEKSIDNQNTFINLAAVEPDDSSLQPEVVEKEAAAVTTREEVQPAVESEQAPARQVQTRAATSSLTAKPAGKKKSKGWGFGMGGGSVTAGTNNSTSALFAGSRSPYLSQGITLMNMVASSQETAKTDVEHHTPVSFGLSVSKYLNDRFSLQSGLVYTYLSSEWNTSGMYSGEVKQKLHYLGIPLSVVYKIAQWNKFVFYASAGGMGEINVAGREKTKLYVREAQVSESDVDIRMHQMLWSVNANVGVSYPLIRFVNVFAETGASYYFDNGSDIETIHSEKPFNVNFQLGFRFGF